MMLFSFFIFVGYSYSRSPDYWSDTFDDDKNCRDKQTHQIWDSDKGKNRCHRLKTMKDNRAYTLNMCKQTLNEKLVKYCRTKHYAPVGSPGRFLYCSVRATLTCCFVQETCSSESAAEKMAVEILQDRKGYLEKLKMQDYKTCHYIENLNATECANDCAKLQKQEFANQCSSDGGFFKCCIVLKVPCHECQYCCTLPMCTYPPGGLERTTFENQTKTKDESTISAISSVDECIKPFSHKNPKKWHSYRQNDFLYAHSKKSFENLKSYETNEYWNWIDPEVLKAVTEGPKAVKNLQSFFWNSYVARIPKDLSRRSIFPCLKRCVQMENSNYARSCKRLGGYFKCCANSLDLSPYEVDQKLSKKGLLPSRPSICKPSEPNDSCSFCRIHGSCSKPKKGRIKQYIFPQSTPFIRGENLVSF